MVRANVLMSLALPAAVAGTFNFSRCPLQYARMRMFVLTKFTGALVVRPTKRIVNALARKIVMRINAATAWQNQIIIYRKLTNELMLRKKNMILFGIVVYIVNLQLLTAKKSDNKKKHEKKQTRKVTRQSNTQIMPRCLKSETRIGSTKTIHIIFVFQPLWMKK